MGVEDGADLLLRILEAVEDIHSDVEGAAVEVDVSVLCGCDCLICSDTGSSQRRDVPCEGLHIWATSRDRTVHILASSSGSLFRIFPLHLDVSTIVQSGEIFKLKNRNGVLPPTQKAFVDL